MFLVGLVRESVLNRCAQNRLAIRCIDQLSRQFAARLREDICAEQAEENQERDLFVHYYILLFYVLFHAYKTITILPTKIQFGR